MEVVRPTIVFDMDGVLVDVKESYRETIRWTVRHFTGRDIDNDAIQDYKNAGGWNNDWALSQRICADYGVELSYETVVQVFQSFFFGENNDGLVLRERWLPSEGMLERLASTHNLAIFTGRLRDEAAFTLRRFAPGLAWSMIVADDDVTQSKPAPEGLLKIGAAFPGSTLIYLGDTVDDANSALAAQVRFVGVAHANLPKRDVVIGLLRQAGAVAVIEDVNDIERVIEQQCAQRA